MKLSLLLNLERQSSFLGAWKADGAPGGGRAVVGDGSRNPCAAALRSVVPVPPISSLDCVPRKQCNNNSKLSTRFPAHDELGTCRKQCKTSMTSWVYASIQGKDADDDDG